MGRRKIVLAAISAAALIVLAFLAYQTFGGSEEASLAASRRAVAWPVDGESLLRDQQVALVQEAKKKFRREYLAGEKDRRRLYEAYVDEIGVNGILDVLEESYCHSQAHPLGKIIYARLGDLGEAFHLAGTRCTSAVFHGVLMEALGAAERHVSRSRLEGEIDSICTREEVAATQKLGNCVHGIGHAVMSVAGYDIEKALESCRGLSLKPLQYYCATGAFMEHALVHGEDDIKRSMHYPCDTYADFPAACYRYKMFYTVEKMLDGGSAIGDVAQECIGLARMSRLGCFHGMGYAFLERISQSPEEITVVCGFGDSDDQHVCIEGAVEKLADLDEPVALRACEYLEGNNRAVCLGAAREKMYRLAKDFSLYFDGG